MKKGDKHARTPVFGGAGGLNRVQFVTLLSSSAFGEPFQVALLKSSGTPSVPPAESKGETRKEFLLARFLPSA